MKLRLKPSERREIAKAFSLVLNIGVVMTACIVGCLLIGRWLDSMFNTSPLFLLIFILLGSVSAIWSLYKIVMDTMK